MMAIQRALEDIQRAQVIAAEIARLIEPKPSLASRFLRWLRAKYYRGVG